MRAITYSSMGKAEDVLILEELDTPQPQAGEVLVRLHTSAVNPSDVKARAGQRAGASSMHFPKIIPHSDGAGVVEATGSGVDTKRVGERVWIWNGQWKRAFGTAAEYIVVKEEQAVSLPSNVSFEVGATLGIPALTACHGVFGNGDVAGQILLINGGAGTVGNLAVKMAHAGGARVLSTVNGEEDILRAKQAGADHVFDFRDEKLAENILEVTSGQLVDRIIEVEFGSNIETDVQVIKENGRIVSYGSAFDQTPNLPFYPLMFKAVTMELVLVYLLSAEKRAKAISGLNSLLTDEALDIPIHATYELSDCASAHTAVETEKRVGSVILKI